MNINKEKLNIEEIIEKANKIYAENGRNKEFVELEKKVISTKNAYYDYMFAKDVSGANIELFEDEILKTHSHKYVYYFGRDVKGASYKLFISKDINEDEIFVVAPLKQMSSFKEEYLNMLFKNVKFRYNTHGLFVVEVGSSDNQPTNLFYIDEYTTIRVNKVIEREGEFEPLFLYYAVEAGSYKIVKTLLDYNKFCKVNYSDFKLTDTFSTAKKSMVAHNRPYTCLVNEAKELDDKRILRLIRSKIKESINEDTIPSEFGMIR